MPSGPEKDNLRDKPAARANLADAAADQSAGKLREEAFRSLGHVEASVTSERQIATGALKAGIEQVEKSGDGHQTGVVEKRSATQAEVNKLARNSFEGARAKAEPSEAVQGVQSPKGEGLPANADARAQAAGGHAPSEAARRFEKVEDRPAPQQKTVDDAAAKRENAFRQEHNNHSNADESNARLDIKAAAQTVARNINEMASVKKAADEGESRRALSVSREKESVAPAEKAERDWQASRTSESGKKSGQADPAFDRAPAGMAVKALADRVFAENIAVGERVEKAVRPSPFDAAGKQVANMEPPAGARESGLSERTLPPSARAGDVASVVSAAGQRVASQMVEAATRAQETASGGKSPEPAGNRAAGQANGSVDRQAAEAARPTFHVAVEDTAPARPALPGRAAPYPPAAHSDGQGETKKKESELEAPHRYVGPGSQPEAEKEKPWLKTYPRSWGSLEKPGSDPGPAVFLPLDAKNVEKRAPLSASADASGTQAARLRPGEGAPLPDIVRSESHRTSQPQAHAKIPSGDGVPALHVNSRPGSEHVEGRRHERAAQPAAEHRGDARPQAAAPEQKSARTTAGADQKEPGRPQPQAGGREQAPPADTLGQKPARMAAEPVSETRQPSVADRAAAVRAIPADAARGNLPGADSPRQPASAEHGPASRGGSASSDSPRQPASAEHGPASRGGSASSDSQRQPPSADQAGQSRGSSASSDSQRQPPSADQAGASRGAVDLPVTRAGLRSPAGGKRQLTGAEIVLGAIMAAAATARLRADDGRGQHCQGETPVESGGEDTPAADAVAVPPAFAGDFYVPGTVTGLLPVGAIADSAEPAGESATDCGGTRFAYQALMRPLHLVKKSDTLVGIAEHLFHDGNIGWLIADLNAGRLKERWIEGKRVVELTCRQEIVLPVWQDIVAFYQRKAEAAVADNIITVIVESQVDKELVDALLNPVVGRSAQSLPQGNSPGLSARPAGVAYLCQPMRPSFSLASVLKAGYSLRTFVPELREKARLLLTDINDRWPKPPASPVLDLPGSGH